MKQIAFASLIATLISISSAFAHADPACTALGNFVGINYKLVSKTCNTMFFGDEFQVVPYIASNFSGYNLTSGGASIGPSTSTNSTDRCTAAAGETVIVETCAKDQNCLPRGWEYNISKSTVVFSMNGCQAKYSAQ